MKTENKNKKSEYDLQAENFLKKTNTTFKAEFLRYDFYFPCDKEKRDIYQITLTRGSRKFVFEYGQSLVKSGIIIEPLKGTCLLMEEINSRICERIKVITGKMPKNVFFLQYENTLSPKECAGAIFCTYPTAYDVLACLQKYDPGTFENFCGDFGYDTDSRTAEKTYKAVVNEYQNLAMLYNDQELAELQEIN